MSNIYIKYYAYLHTVHVLAICIATFNSSLIERIFWHTDSIKRFSPSAHEASKSTNFSSICRSGSESSPLTSNSHLFETLCQSYLCIFLNFLYLLCSFSSSNPKSSLQKAFLVILKYLIMYAWLRFNGRSNSSTCITVYQIYPKGLHKNPSCMWCSPKPIRKCRLQWDKNS